MEIRFDTVTQARTAVVDEWAHRARVRAAVTVVLCVAAVVLILL